MISSRTFVHSRSAASRRGGASRFRARSLPAVLLAAFLSLAVFASPASADQTGMLLSLLSQMESSYARLKDYTAIFRKKERYGDKQLPEERIMVKFQKPFKVYMKWVDGPDKEALYVNGEYDNKVIAHSEGLLGFTSWTFNPTDSLLMKDNRHPITDIGFGFIIDIMHKNIPLAIKNSEFELIRLAEETFEGRPTVVIEARFTPRDGRKYYASHVICHVDKEYLLPIGVSCYDEKEVLQEQYSYLDVKLNTGLSDMDFSKNNKAYKF